MRSGGVFAFILTPPTAGANENECETDSHSKRYCSARYCPFSHSSAGVAVSTVEVQLVSFVDAQNVVTLFIVAIDYDVVGAPGHRIQRQRGVDPAVVIVALQLHLAGCIENCEHSVVVAAFEIERVDARRWGGPAVDGVS